MANIDYASNMGKALAAWVDENKDKRGFVLVAYEKEDDGVVTSSSAMGNVGIAAECAVRTGLDNQSGPIGVFVKMVNNMVALNFLEKIKNGGEK